MEDRRILQNLRTRIVGKKPSPNEIYEGEIVVNFGKGGETLMIKNTEEEIIEFKDKHYIDSVIDTVSSEVDDKLLTKQDVINDIEDIRNGANLGATALQSVPTEYVTELELNAKGYLTLEAVQQLIKNATSRIDGGIIGTTNTPSQPPTVNSIGEITESNEIIINEDMLSAGTYTLKYLDGDDNIVDNSKPITEFTI